MSAPPNSDAQGVKCCQSIAIIDNAFKSENCFYHKSIKWPCVVDRLSYNAN
jgi:hypothetical protein